MGSRCRKWASGAQVEAGRHGPAAGPGRAQFALLANSNGEKLRLRSRDDPRFSQAFETCPSLSFFPRPQAPAGAARAPDLDPHTRNLCLHARRGAAGGAGGCWVDRSIDSVGSSSNKHHLGAAAAGEGSHRDTDRGFDTPPRAAARQQQRSLQTNPGSNPSREARGCGRVDWFWVA